MGEKLKTSGLLTVRLAVLSAFMIGIFATMGLSRSFATPEINRSLIFVVDSSEQMVPYLEDVKGAILMSTDQAKSGDYIGVVSFSDIAMLMTLKKITGPRELKSLGITLEALRAKDGEADVAGGLARALEDIVRLVRRGDKNIKGVIIISASQSPEGSEGAAVLAHTVAQLSEHIDDDDWYIQYCYLNGVIDSRVAKFVEEHHGFTYDLDSLRREGATETAEELYTIITSPEEMGDVRVKGLHGTLLGRPSAGKSWMSLKDDGEVAEGTYLRTPTDSRVVISLDNWGKLGLAPEAKLTLLTSRMDPITGAGYTRVALDAGTVWICMSKTRGNLIDIDTAGTSVRLSGRAAVAACDEKTDKLVLVSASGPLSVELPETKEESFELAENQLARLGHNQVLSEIEAAEAKTMEQWKAWSKAFIHGAALSSITFVVPELIFPEEEITVGPIVSGTKESRSYPLRIDGLGGKSGLKLVVEVSLALPEGLALTTGIIDGEVPDEKELHLKIDATAGFRSERAETYKGILRIMPDESSGIMFEKLAVPIILTTKGPIVPPSILVIGIGAVVALVVVGGGWVLLRSKEAARPRPHRVVGRLIIVNDPTNGRVGTINLEDISTKSSRLSLVVGRNRSAEVRMKHASVEPDHCTLEANLVGGRLETYIEPIGAAKVLVNGEAISSKTCLNDGARIEIGEFSYQFEDSQLYKRVDVVYRNGRRLSGILDATGMDAEGFRLSPMDAVSPSERARVGFSDIRYVIFKRRVADILSGKQRRMPRAESMKRLELMFKKGNTMSGYVQREYTEGRRKYVELLPLDSESDIDYTVVDYSAVVEKRNL